MSLIVAGDVGEPGRHKQNFIVAEQNIFFVHQYRPLSYNLIVQKFCSFPQDVCLFPLKTCNHVNMQLYTWHFIIRRICGLERVMTWCHRPLGQGASSSVLEIFVLTKSKSVSIEK